MKMVLLPGTVLGVGLIVDLCFIIWNFVINGYDT